ncbi:hypothetical protein HF923_12040 [Acidithiobacillus ferriphilus]|uniref:hypothetical protein n=1 Tax=Acidithiobacillus ferriphilus TaxID=1689834 RepID=UPI001C07B1C0|nr:hypothetical protein [Acidithiobacillus ferriphilus]MBU2846522.1 hypothetical protein [Acidithiobacillus ferriphilus]
MSCRFLKFPHRRNSAALVEPDKMTNATETPQYVTVKQFAEKHPAFSLGGLRSAIFWKREELEKSQAVAQLGRRVLINEPRFLAFVQSGGLKSVRGAA